MPIGPWPVRAAQREGVAPRSFSGSPPSATTSLPTTSGSRAALSDRRRSLRDSPAARRNGPPGLEIKLPASGPCWASCSAWSGTRRSRPCRPCCRLLVGQSPGARVGARGLRPVGRRGGPVGRRGGARRGGRFRAGRRDDRDATGDEQQSGDRRGQDGPADAAGRSSSQPVGPRRKGWVPVRAAGRWVPCGTPCLRMGPPRGRTSPGAWRSPLRGA